MDGHYRKIISLNVCVFATIVKTSAVIVMGEDRREREGTWLEESIEGLVAESSSILPRRAVVAIAEHFEYASDEQIFLHHLPRG